MTADLAPAAGMRRRRVLFAVFSGLTRHSQTTHKRRFSENIIKIFEKV
jgi:hypothetical protein